MECQFRDPSLHKEGRRYVTIPTVGGGQIRRDGKTLFSRMADLAPYVVRSEQEQAKKERAAKRCIGKLEELREAQNYQSADSKFRAARITMALRDLSMPMFGVELGTDRNGDPVRVYVSPSVLRDWRRDGQKPTLFAMPNPHARQHGMRGLRTVEIHDEIVRNQADSRRNNHAIGLAQTAWRYAKLEGDTLALRAARHWLWHGTMRPCRDPGCEDCAKQGRMSATSLSLLAYTLLYYVHGDMEGEESIGRRTKRALPSHRMPKTPPKGFLGERKDVDRKVYERAVKDGRLEPRQ